VYQSTSIMVYLLELIEIGGVPGRRRTSVSLIVESL